MQIIQSRRDVLAGLAGTVVAGTVGGRRALATEPQPETTAVRLPKFFSRQL
jgi:hypothetical protein